MKPLYSLLPLLLLGCSPSTPPTTVSLTGTPGAPITGFYIRDGHRTDINATLPLTSSNLSVFAVRKLNPADALHAEAHGPSGGISTSSPAGNPGGYRLQLGDGAVSSESISPDQSLSPPHAP